MFNLDFYTDIIDLPDKEETENKISYPLDLNIKSAEGCYLIDETDNRYLDLTSNKECNPLGYSFISQVDNGYLFDSELFTSTDSINLENSLKRLTGLNKAIFTSSKSESQVITNKLIKTYLSSNTKNKILVSCLYKNRTNYHFDNISVDFIPLNNDTLVRSLLTKSVGAVIIDLVQIGEDILIANQEYLTLLRALCNRVGALLVFDASSVSPQRTLNGPFNFDSALVKPDILIISNSTAQGIPFGAVIISDKLDEIPGTGSTIFAYKSALKFINECTNPEAVAIINNNRLYIEKSLNELAERFITVADVISYGMLYTIILDISAFDFVKEALKRQIILEALNSRTIKLSPPYNIGKEEIDKLMYSFEDILDNLAKYDRLM